MSFYSFLALLPAVLWASCITIDKVIVSKYIPRPLMCVLWSGIMYLLLALGILYFKSVFLNPPLYIGIAFLSGIAYLLGLLMYYKALRVEEVSRVAPLLMGLVPLFVLFLGTIFFNEIFTLKTYLGFFLVLTGSLSISIKKEVFRLKLSRAVGTILFGAFLWAMWQCLWKGALGSIDYWSCLFWFYAGTVSISFILIGKHRVLFINTFKKAGKKVISAMSLSCILNFAAMILFVFIISKWFLSLASVLGATHGIFILFFAVILSKFFPKFLEEELKKSTILFKFLAIILIILGIYFIN